MQFFRIGRQCIGNRGINNIAPLTNILDNGIRNIVDIINIITDAALHDICPHAADKRIGARKANQNIIGITTNNQVIQTIASKYVGFNRRRIRIGSQILDISP